MDPPPGVGGSKPKLGDLRIYARNLGDLRGMFGSPLLHVTIYRYILLYILKIYSKYIDYIANI